MNRLQKLLYKIPRIKKVMMRFPYGSPLFLDKIIYKVFIKL